MTRMIGIVLLFAATALAGCGEFSGGGGGGGVYSGNQNEGGGSY